MSVDKIDLDPVAYARLSRDSVRERDLIRQLQREHTEAERLAFIDGLLDQPCQSCFIYDLIDRTLRERSSFEHYLSFAAKVANRDLSDHRYWWSHNLRAGFEARINYIGRVGWLEAIVPHLGIRRTIRLLQRHAGDPLEYGDGPRNMRCFLEKFRDQPGYDQAEVDRINTISIEAARRLADHPEDAPHE